jgi:hypothetical protein
LSFETKTKALLEGTLSDAPKARLLVERVGILDLLPDGLSDDWPHFWTVIGHKIDGFWHMGDSADKGKKAKHLDRQRALGRSRYLATGQRRA